MALSKDYWSGVDRARFYRDICLEAAGLPKYKPLYDDLVRWAFMWDRIARQLEGDIKRIAESRELLSRIEKQLRL
jgi:hypothetical protein